MQKILLGILSIVFFCSASASAETIAVMGAQHPDQQVAALYGQQITDSITNVTKKFKRFSLVERSQNSNIAKELKFQNSSSMIDDRTAVGIGQQSGAQLIALSSFLITASTEKVTNKKSSYNKYGMGLNVNIRFVDVKTGQVVFSKQIPASSSGSDQAQLIASSLVDFERKFEREMTTAFPNFGYVIKMISESEYMIDIGRSSGASVDDVFSIYIEGEDIVHPVTKDIIKGDKNVIAEATVTSVSEQSSTVKISQIKPIPIEIGVAKVEAKPKKKGFFEAIEDFSRGVGR